MEVKENIIEQPFFSICIPQYNRTSFLIEACKVLAQQTFKNFEVCVSDDRSTDGRENELIEYLQQSGMSFLYKKQEINQRYDGNIRSSIALAKGKYCLLHGNDDCLTSPTTLEEIYQQIQKYDSVAVVVSNFEDWTTGKIHPRIRKSRLVGAGPEVAATHFRNLAFVTGIVMDRVKAQNCYTNKWDGSEMYQMYVFGTIVASGGSLLELTNSTVRKDIQIPDEFVDDVSLWHKVNPCPIIERKLPMLIIGPLVADAISPYLDNLNRSRVVAKIFLQLYSFTYPYWIIEYRRLQSWKYSLGVCLGMRPQNTFIPLNLGFFITIQLYILYILICTLGLSLPIFFVDGLRPFLYSIAKTLFSKTSITKTTRAVQV